MGSIGRIGVGLCLETISKPTRGRVASENEMPARKDDDAMLDGMARSPDAAARLRRNPKGRAACAPGRRYPAKTTCPGRHRPRALAGSQIRTVATRVGLEIVSQYFSLRAPAAVR
jgi:hypothetical protein